MGLPLLGWIGLVLGMCLGLRLAWKIWKDGDHG
jgi:hypothetical protein